MVGEAPFNPATLGATQAQAGGPGTIAGGRALGGLLPNDTPGFLNGTQGWGQKNILDGGAFSLNSGNKKPPGLLGQLGLTPGAIADSLKQIVKNDPVIQGGLQAVAQQMSGGVENVSMASSGHLSSAGAPMMAGAASAGMEV